MTVASFFERSSRARLESHTAGPKYPTRASITLKDGCPFLAYSGPRWNGRGSLYSGPFSVSFTNCF